MKIAIVDSGISSYYAELIKHSGISYNVCDEKIEISDRYDDECGHGTACTHIIHTYISTKSEVYYFVKILDKNNMSHSELLINALDHLLSIDVDIINLSLSVYDDYYIDDLCDIIHKLHKQDKLIISSADNRNITNILSNIPWVYTTIGIPNMETSQIIINNFNINTSSVPVLVPNIQDNNKYYFFGGNSKATALATAIIANTKYNENINNNYMIMEYLRKLPCENVIMENDLEYDFQDISRKELHVILNQILTNYIDISQINLKKIFELGINKYNAFDVIRDIENYLNINFDYSKINLFHFNNIDSLCNIFKFIVK